jgi:hypothetical protein
MLTMFRTTSEAQSDRALSEYGEGRAAGTTRRLGSQSSRSNRVDRGRSESKARRNALCWVDVFDEEYFSARLTRLHEGDFKDMRAPASMIVGPDATARCVDRRTNKARHFQSRTVCPVISLGQGTVSFRVEVISANG